jgi:cytochrome c551/c552
MKTVFLAAILISQAALAAEPPPSLTHYRCYICHSDREPLVGPAFADIATAYQGRRDAVPSIANDIRAGMKTGGPWHMPPHPEVSREEARAMARYIMSLSAQEPKSREAKQLR